MNSDSMSDALRWLSHATTFTFGDPLGGPTVADMPITIDNMGARHGKGSDLWAVRRMGRCLSKQGTWEWEPQPSDRDKDFFARCRFASRDEAYLAMVNRTER